MAVLRVFVLSHAGARQRAAEFLHRVADGMDLKAGTWFCAQHAPAKLLAAAHGIGGKGGAA